MSQILIGGTIACAGFHMRILTEVTIRSEHADERILTTTKSYDSSNGDNNLNYIHTNSCSDAITSNSSSSSKNIPREHIANATQSLSHTQKTNKVRNLCPVTTEGKVLPTSTPSASSIRIFVPNKESISVTSINKYTLERNKIVLENGRKGYNGDCRTINSSNTSNSSISTDIYSEKCKESICGDSSSSGKANNEKCGNYHRNSSSSNFTSYPLQDPLVWQVMRPHQREAATFLLDKLMGKHNEDDKVVISSKIRENENQKGKEQINIPIINNSNLKKNNDVYQKEENTNQKGKIPSDSSSGSYEFSQPLTGAILADDMGTGKVLTALYCTVLHCTALHCTVLYCTLLYAL